MYNASGDYPTHGIGKSNLATLPFIKTAGLFGWGCLMAPGFLNNLCGNYL
jgi:hypothetical protein